MDVPSLNEVRAAVDDNYEVERLLGKGGMGAVFLGRHRSLGSQVAIKVLPMLAEPDSSELARFKREATLAANLPHPHIVPVFEFQIEKGLAYFIMPFIEGDSLAELLEKQNRLEFSEVRLLVEQIGSALAHAHERGVIHRDVKPANILREHATGRWLIADFGIARGIQPEETGITGTGMAVGTPAYWAPEQAMGMPDVDGRADLFALGEVAFEALTGEPAYKLSDPAQVEHALRTARPDVRSGVRRVLIAPLAFDREDRPESVRSWLDTLEIARGKSDPTARILTAVTVAAVLLVVGIGLSRWLGETSEAANLKTIAVAPLIMTGGSDPALEQGLARAFEDQLRWLPEHRVVGSAALAQAMPVVADSVQQWDSVASLAASRFGASELLVARVEVETDRIRVDVQIRDASTGMILRSADADGPVDSLSRIVSDLVAKTFAEQLAREQTGWSSALPIGMGAIQAYFAGDELYRSAAYDQAIERYEAVIAADSTFAPAYFKKMLCEVFRARPTRVTGAIRSALDAARDYRAGLDPTTDALLGAYEILVAEGRLQQSHDILQEIVSQHPDAADAWFLMGFLEVYFGPLFGTPPAAAQFALVRAHELDPSFAAAISHLGLIAVLQENKRAAQRYFEAYLAIDSISVWAELVRMVDSALYRGVKAALGVTGSFDVRPTAALEVVAMGGANPDLGVPERALTGLALDALVERATTDQDRAITFRMQMAASLGAGRVASVDTLMREARRRNIPRTELDRWIVLTAVTETVPLADEEGQSRSAARLMAQAVEDPVANWLVARWYSERDPGAAATALARLRSLAAEAAATPQEQSLVEGMTALSQVAAGDTLAAYETWRQATERYSIERVPFGFVASLWPLRLEWARVAAARGDHDEVLAATTVFEYAVGFMDQVAWSIALRLRAEALRASDDELGARATFRLLGNTLRDANGTGVALRDSVVMWSGGVTNGN